MAIEVALNKNVSKSKCECSTCGHIAKARPNTPHLNCKGIRLSILAQFPANLQSLSIPNRQGTWECYQAQFKPQYLKEQNALMIG